MPNVTFNEEVISCSKALKGPDYIHLLDANGVMIAAFDGIVDFSAFTITNGDWTSPPDDSACPIAIVRPDGTIGKGGHTCKDIDTNANISIYVILSSEEADWTTDENGNMVCYVDVGNSYTNVVIVDIPMVLQRKLIRISEYMSSGTKYIKFTCRSLPPSNTPVELRISQVYTTTHTGTVPSVT